MLQAFRGPVIVRAKGLQANEVRAEETRPILQSLSLKTEEEGRAGLSHRAWQCPRSFFLSSVFSQRRKVLLLRHREMTGGF